MRFASMQRCPILHTWYTSTRRSRAGEVAASAERCANCRAGGQVRSATISAHRRCTQREGPISARRHALFSIQPANIPKLAAHAGCKEGRALSSTPASMSADIVNECVRVFTTGNFAVVLIKMGALTTACI